MFQLSTIPNWKENAKVAILKACPLFQKKTNGGVPGTCMRTHSNGFHRKRENVLISRTRVSNSKHWIRVDGCHFDFVFPKLLLGGREFGWQLVGREGINMISLTVKRRTTDDGLCLFTLNSTISSHHELASKFLPTSSRRFLDYWHRDSRCGTLVFADLPPPPLDPNR